MGANRPNSAYSDKYFYRSSGGFSDPIIIGELSTDVTYVYRMCGIWALLGFDNDVSSVAMECWKLHHRGPDATRVEMIHGLKKACFGFHHLSIMSQTEGMQPLRIKSEPNLWLIYNGEIYNHTLIAEDFGFQYESLSDGESILQLYAKGGIDLAVRHLDGMYAIILLDLENRMLHLARDPYGIKPLFRSTGEDGVLGIASEAKGLINVPRGTSGKMLHIEHFPPGCYETYSIEMNERLEFKEQIRFHRIGQIPLYRNIISHSDNKDVYQNIRRLLQAAVEKRLMANRRVGCFLSGGLDSSLIAALLLKVSKEKMTKYPIQTFAIGLPGSVDLTFAKKVADYIGSEHHEIVVSEQQIVDVIGAVIYYTETFDPATLRSAFCSFLLSKYIKQCTNTTVILSGEGADELCQGYSFFHKTDNPEALDRTSRHLLQDLHYNAVLRCDRTTSAHGLEMRVPYLDAHFSAYYLSLPAVMRTPQHGVEKHLLRYAFTNTRLLPDDVLWRPKVVFAEGMAKKSSWFNRILHDGIARKVSLSRLEDVQAKFQDYIPETAEQFYYRRIFESFYPQQLHLTPYLWTSTFDKTDL